MSMNIVEPPQGACWGRFNDRILNPAWVQELVEGFRQYLDNCTDIKAIDVGVKREWLEDDMQIVKSVEGRKIEDIPLIRFSEAGKAETANKNLWVFGGNHRRAALCIYISKLEEERTKTQQKITAIETGTSNEQQNLGSLKNKLEKLAKKVEVDKHWVIRLYDRGASK